MGFHPFEVSAAHLAYTFLGAFVVLFGMLSLVIKEKLYIGEAPIATVLGIIIGPHALGFFDPGSWGGTSSTVTDEITLEVTRVVIAISVFAVGVELPKAYMKRHWRSLFFLLGPCMVWGWMVSALLIWALIPKLSFLASLVVAAPVTPTDPILAQAVIGGSFADRHVPAHVRHLLSAESGSNDGAAFPFLYIAIYLLLDASPGHAIGEWFYLVWAYEIILGSLIGAILGFSARKAMKFAERKRLIDRQSYVAQYVSLAVLSIGMTSLLGSDDLLSAFACGCAFAWDGFFNKATEDAVFSNVIDLLFNCAAFIYIGAIIPFGEFNVPDLRVWRLVVLAILVLLLRRLPAIMATYKFIPDIKTFREALFVGWFGPMGVGAIFISTLARTSLPEGDAERNTEMVDRLREVIAPVTAFLVLASVVTHGLSIPFFSLGRRVHSITYTRSRQLSMDARGDEPAWTTHARRIQPGQQITINRDDDPEEGDLSIRRRDTYDSRVNGEKLAEKDSGESGGSSSSRTAREEPMEMQEKRHSGESRRSEEDGQNDEDKTPGEDRALTDAEAAAEGGADHEHGDEGAKDGSRTPPLAEFREGHHLIIERKKPGTDEIEVEVIRNHFHDDKDSERDTFLHPHRLKHKEVDRLIDNLPKSLDHATSHVKNDGKHAIDSLGLGLMDPDNSSVSSIGQGSTRDRAGSPDSSMDDDDEHDREDEEGQGHGRRNVGPPAIRVDSGGSGSGSGSGRRKRTLRDRLFGRRQDSSDRAGQAGQAEEGRSTTDSNLLVPPSRSSTRPRRIVSEPEEMSDDDRDGSASGSASGSGSGSGSGGLSIPLTRTLSPSRSPAIRFAPESSLSSDTAPGISNYGNNAPGFRKNPALAMYRAGSIQSTHSSSGVDAPSPSVSFKVPDKRR